MSHPGYNNAPCRVQAYGAAYHIKLLTMVQSSAPHDEVFK